jgi:putative transposase
MARQYDGFMARPLRIEFPGGLYHFIVRGNERKAVFRDDADREDYLRRLAHYRKKFGFRLLAYCLMDNHVHLVIESGSDPLSRIMAGLQSSYTQYFNRRHRRVGHLFQGRYKAFLVERDPYALALLRYVHENPVKARIVLKPEEYPWSSDRAYRRGRSPDWLDVDRLLRMLGARRSVAIRAYRRLMREELEQPYEDVASWGQAVKGDRPFADLAFQKVGEPKLPRPGLTVETVAIEVAKRRKLSLEKMRSPSQGREESLGRALVAWAGREVGLVSLARTAKYFNRDTSSMARLVERLARRADSNKELLRFREGLASKLHAQHAI